MNVLETIRNIAETDPGRLVFSSRDGKLTYGQLWQKSGRLAYRIREMLKDDHSPIPIYGHKEPLMLVCFLAAARAGNPYCPMDMNMPASRIYRIANVTESRLVLACRDFPEPDADMQNAPGAEAEPDIYQKPQARILSEEEIEQFCSDGPEISPEFQNRPEDVQYIIFTSGSTGNPKGVQISTGALANYLDWCSPLTGMDNGVFLNQAPYSFDLSVMDLYCALATGSGIVSVDKAMEQDMPTLLDYLENSGISCWVSTPSFADLCLSDPGFSQSSLPRLQRFLFCGETLRNTTARQLLKRFPQADVYNTYGPTESTVCVTSVRITKQLADSSDPLPIGMAKPGTEIRIEAEPGTSAAPGESGEMVIIGNTVGVGYFKEPDKTAASFFLEKDGSYFPFPASPDEIPARLQQGFRLAYRTGDAGYQDENGMLYYEGRIDKQIKFHGYRIELGDIENSLLKLDAVKQAAVIPNMRDGRIRFLTAFIVPEAGSGLTDTFEHRKSVRTALKELLPAYMVPRQIRMLSRMPLTANGKVDRKLLESEL